VFFGLDERERAWRDEVRSFIDSITDDQREQFGQEMRELGVERHSPTFFGMLCERGWVGLQFPEPWGLGAPDTERFILHEELAAAGLGLLYGVEISEAIGWMLVRNGPASLAGEHLPNIIDGTWSYAGGYSEPEAGSDLLNIRTRARREGDTWVIDGAKMWTSAAHIADFIFAVVRTDPASQRHHGLSIILIPTDDPGVEIRPVPVLGGWRVNACFFDGVQVPVSNTVGEPGQGWKVLSEALNTERAMSFGGSESRLLLSRIVDRFEAEGRSLSEVDRQRLFELTTELEVERLLVMRAAAMAARGEVADAEASMGKIVGSETAQRVAEWAVDVLGGATVFGDSDVLGPVGSLAHDDPLGAEVEEFLRVSTVLTVIGGTSEVQRNVIASRRLGLPRS
jgi:alkylation response protein AidB-like acyl-CoA dehydrogenase